MTKWNLGSIPERVGDKIYNTSPIFSPAGQLVAIHRKVHLFDISIPGGVTFRESETLTGGDDITIVETGQSLTHISRIMTERRRAWTDFGKIGVGICYDVRFPELCAIAARKGCVAMIYPGAFNLSTGPLHWDLLMRARYIFMPSASIRFADVARTYRATDNQMYVALCSPARATTGDGYKAWGFSGVADPMFVLSLVGRSVDSRAVVMIGDVSSLSSTRKKGSSTLISVSRAKPSSGYAN